MEEKQSIISQEHSNKSQKQEIAKAEKAQPDKKVSTDTKTEDKKEKKKPTKAHKEKQKAVKELVKQIQEARTLMVVNIKGLPSPQFQSIKKELREHAQIKVAKKNILKRVIEEIEKESILPMEKEIQENCAFAISNLEGFELAGILAKNKTPIYAKAGQIANEDIEVKAGPTSLLPGPAISELGSLGIQIAVEEGKISIRAPKIVVQKGGKINQSAASLFQKLDIKPFKIGLEPIALYDIQNEKIYKDIKVDSEEAVEDLRSAHAKALGLAQKIVYYCKETIGYLLAKANANIQALDKFETKEEPKQEVKPKEKKEEIDTLPEQQGEEKEAKVDKKPATESSPEKPTEDNKNTQTKSKEDK